MERGGGGGTTSECWEREGKMTSWLGAVSRCISQWTVGKQIGVDVAKELTCSC